MIKTGDVTSNPAAPDIIVDEVIGIAIRETEEIHTKNIDEIIRYIEGGKKKASKQNQKTPVTSVSPSIEEYPEMDKEVDEFRQRLDIPISPERLRVHISEEFLEKLKNKMKKKLNS